MDDLPPNFEPTEDADQALGDEPTVEPVVEPLPNLEPEPRRGLLVTDPPRLRARDVVVLVVVMLLVGVVHFARLANPDHALPQTDDQCKKYPRLSSVCHEMIPLDEYHYLPDARDVIRYGTESDTRIEDADARSGYTDGAYVVHPPVGKWFIAAGIKLFGDSGFGWRFFGALLGVLASLLMWLIGRRLWGSPWLSSAAALLLGIEGLWLVMSRVAMLDITMAFFVLLAVWLMLEDRARTDPETRGPRWWRIAAGLAWGLALASKWAALPFFAVAVLLAAVWGAADAFGASRRRLPVRALSLAGSLVIIPLLVYVATYAPWFADSHRYDPPKCREITGVLSHAGTFGHWLCYQKEVAAFHAGLLTYNTSSELETITPGGAASPTTTLVRTHKLGHPYFGHAWSWPWIGRPVAHYYVTSGTGTSERVKHIAGIPNPAIWWAAWFAAIPLLLWWALRRRDVLAGILLAFILAGWAPYLYGDVAGKGVFFFYATPMVPFLVLAVVHVMARALARTARARAWLIAYVVIALLALAYFYPVLTAFPIPTSGVWGWSHHMWLNPSHWRLLGRFTIPAPGDCGATGEVIKHFCWI